MRPGRYAATVDVPWLASALATPELIRSKLQEKGFTNVQVSRQKPAGWPLGNADDYYVVVSWAKSPQLFDVPSAVREYRKIA